MLPRDIATPLALVTRFSKAISVFKKGRPIKSALQNLVGSFGGAKVASCLSRVTMLKNSLSLNLRDTSPNHLVPRNLKQKWLFPQIKLSIIKEFLMLRIRKVKGKNVTSHVVNQVGIPRCLGYGQQLLIREGLLNLPLSGLSNRGV